MRYMDDGEGTSGLCCRRWQGFRHEGLVILARLRGLEFEFLKGQGLLAKLLEDGNQASIGGGLFGAEFFDGVPVQTSNDVIGLGDAEVEDGFMQLVRIRTAQNLGKKLLASGEIGSEFLLANPILVTTRVPDQQVIDG